MLFHLTVTILCTELTCFLVLEWDAIKLKPPLVWYMTELMIFFSNLIRSLQKPNKTQNYYYSYFFKQEHWGSERPSDLPKAVWLECDRSGLIPSQVAWRWIPFLFSCYSCNFSFHLIHFMWNADVPGEKSTLLKDCFSTIKKK